MKANTRISKLSLAAAAFIFAMHPQGITASEQTPQSGIKTYWFDKIDDRAIIKNPGIGLSRFNPSANVPIKITEFIGPTSYSRFYWNEFEDRKLGVYDFTKFAQALEGAQRRNEAFAFRIMSAKPGETTQQNSLKLPSALLKLAASKNESVGTFHGSSFIPNFNSPLLLDAAQKLISALGAQYANDPHLLFVDVGLVGFWGEWHLGGIHDDQLPNAINAQKYVDMHLRAFPHTKAVMLIGNGSSTSVNLLNDMLAQPQLGWRADAWGDFRFLDSQHDNHTIVYTKILERAPRLKDSWRNAPTVLETPQNLSAIVKLGNYNPKSDPKKSISQRDNLPAAFDFAEHIHASSINSLDPQHDFVSLPSNLARQYQNLIARLGYRFYLFKAEVPMQLPAGETLKIITYWKNIGIAPSYGNFYLKLRIRDENKKIKSLQTDKSANIDSWMPEALQRQISHQSTLNTQGLCGDFSLELAIHTKFDYPIRLANNNSHSDNWTEFGKVSIRCLPH